MKMKAQCVLKLISTGLFLFIIGKIVSILRKQKEEIHELAEVIIAGSNTVAHDYDDDDDYSDSYNPGRPS